MRSGGRLSDIDGQETPKHNAQSETDLSETLLVQSSHLVVAASSLFAQPVLQLVFPLLLLHIDGRPDGVKETVAAPALTDHRRRLTGIGAVTSHCSGRRL